MFRYYFVREWRGNLCGVQMTTFGIFSLETGSLCLCTSLAHESLASSALRLCLTLGVLGLQRCYSNGIFTGDSGMQVLGLAIKHSHGLSHLPSSEKEKSEVKAPGCTEQRSRGTPETVTDAIFGVHSNNHPVLSKLDLLMSRLRLDRPRLSNPGEARPFQRQVVSPHQPFQ